MASVAPLYLSPVAIRSIDDHTVRTLLGIGIEVDEPALELKQLGANTAELRVPGAILFDRKSQSNYGNVIGTLRRDGSVEMQTALAASPLQKRLTVIGEYALGGTIVYYGTALMSVETLSSITGQSPERVNVGVVKLREGPVNAAFRPRASAASAGRWRSPWRRRPLCSWSSGSGKARRRSAFYSTSAPRSDS